LILKLVKPGCFLINIKIICSCILNIKLSLLKIMTKHISEKKAQSIL
jgi:hypothetical protein